MNGRIIDAVRKYRAGDVTAKGLYDALAFMAEKDETVKAGRKELSPELYRRTVLLAEYLGDCVGVKNNSPDAMRRFATWSDLRTKATMVEGTDDYGGYTVPDFLEDAVFGLVEGGSVILPDCSRYRMQSDTLKVPSWATELSAAWHKESDSATRSEPTLGVVTLSAKRVDSYGIASNELLQDNTAAGGLMTLLLEQFTNVSGRLLDSTVFNSDGTGSAQFSGLFATAKPSYSVVFGTGSAAFSMITVADGIKAAFKVPSHKRETGRLWLHPDVRQYLALEKDLNGQYRDPPYAAAPGTLLGRYGIVESNQAPSTSAPSTACALFGNPRAIAVGLRTGISIVVDPYTRMEYHETRFAFFWRLALGLLDAGAFARIVTAA